MLPLLFLSLSLGSIIAFDRSPDDQLLLVQVVIRHADRASMHGFATNISEEIFFRGNGELSDDGIENAFKQGLDYRERYVKTGFIDERMITNQISIRSSSVPRVLMSAASFTSALFNKTDGGMGRIPPIFTKDSEEDPLLVPPLDCLNGWEDVVKKYNLPFSKNAGKKSAKSASTMRKSRKHAQALVVLMKTEMPEECKVVPPELLEAIVAELPNPHINLPPEWIPCAENGAKKLLFKYMELLAGAGEEFNLQRLQRTAGLLTATLLDNMAAMLNCTSSECDEPKLRVYYTHDINVLASAFIFDAIHLYQNKTPAFSSSLVFELRNGKFGPYVNILLKNGVSAPFVESDRCQKNCTLDAVVELTKSYSIREPAWCQLSEDEVEPSTKRSPVLQSFLSLLSTLSLLYFYHL
ncbi:hypothetical protein PMAYCL1PPCAC_07481 [Pristionchus mayeri]|uniref:acid phosphatase n=1 Tax=Pristionchus mayeri TaxID=1317129 RepID=A0AAN4ZDT6_9BILA|nr:hypothetical protein PMAYCL1PPCAC_07481 [Pristionchus mayeri]